MLDKGLTHAANFADRHDRAITIVGAVWLAVSCAAMARFIDLPDIPYITDRNAWMFSGGWNALWWGFLHPAIEKRRKADRSSPPELEKGES